MRNASGSRQQLHTGGTSREQLRSSAGPHGAAENAWLLECIAWTLLTAFAGAPGSAAETAPLFRDVTAESGLDFQHFNGMTGRLYYLEVVGSGGALFDADGDGDLDLYLVQGNLLGADRTLADALLPWPEDEPLRDRLFRNDLEITADGSTGVRFVDITEASGLRAEAYGMGAAVGDIDGDGDLDLYVLNYGANQLWRNDGPDPQGIPRFTEISGAAGVADPAWSVSATFADLDGNRTLDLFVVNYLEYSLALNKRCLTERGEADYCLPAAYRPQPDRLYLGDGRGAFRDASAHAGILDVPANGLGVVAADFDGDGLQDVYVANDLMPNQLWLHRPVDVLAPGTGAAGAPRDLRLIDEALMLGTALNREGKAEASMGVDLADVDADGDLDLFMAHFRRESNTLFRAGAEGSFRDDSDSSGLGGPSWKHTGFGVTFFDYDLDGWLDVAVANGAVTFVPGADRTKSSFPLDEPNQLFHNLGKGQFEEVSEAAGAAFRGAEVSRSLLRGDLDNDGRIDLVVTNNSGPARVLLNQSPLGAGSWVGVRLLPDSLAQGAMVRLVPGGDQTPQALPPQVRRFQRDGGYAAAHDPRIVLATPEGSAPSLEVKWPDGLVETFSSLRPGQYHDLIRATGEKGADGDR